MLTKIQNDIFEDIQDASNDVEFAMRKLNSSPTHENFRENLRFLISEARTLIRKSEELQAMLLPNSSVTP
jgi:hypothetical protein